MRKFGSRLILVILLGTASVCGAAEKSDEAIAMLHLGFAAGTETITITQGDESFTTGAQPWRLFFEVPFQLPHSSLKIAPGIAYQSLKTTHGEQPFQDLEGQEFLAGLSVAWAIRPKFEVLTSYQRLISANYSSGPAIFKTSPDTAIFSKERSGFRTTGAAMSLGAQWTFHPRVAVFVSAILERKELKPSFFYSGADPRFFKTAVWAGQIMNAGLILRFDAFRS